MSNIEDGIDPINARTGLFALITARLEDAHETAIKGQASKTTDEDIANHITDIRSILDEVNIQLDAAELISKP